MKYVLLLLSLLIIGCTNNNTTSASTTSQNNRYDINGYPRWIADPTLSGKYSYGAAGSAGRSFKGPSHQRQLAVQRALEEIASQIETNIVSETNSIDYATNNTSSYQSKTTSTYKIDKNVSGKIIDVWEDRINSQLYVWMVVE